jgi:hypothetical protein
LTDDIYLKALCEKVHFSQNEGMKEISSGRLTQGTPSRRENKIQAGIILMGRINQGKSRRPQSREDSEAGIREWGNKIHFSIRLAKQHPIYPLNLGFIPSIPLIPAKHFHPLHSCSRILQAACKKNQSFF